MRCLCAGESRAKTLNRSTNFGQFVVGHRFDFAAEQDFFGLDADLGADLARDQDRCRR